MKVRAKGSFEVPWGHVVSAENEALARQWAIIRDRQPGDPIDEIAREFDPRKIGIVIEDGRIKGADGDGE